MAPEISPPDRSTLTAFAGAVVIGGANFIAVKFSNEGLDPIVGAALRFGLAAILFFAIAAFLRIPLPRGQAALGAVLYGALGFGIAYGMLYFALIEVTAGTASVIMASVPLLTLILAVAHRQERFTARGVVGGALAVIGIAVLSRRSLESDLDPIYIAAALVGALAVAESTVVVKGYPRAHPITTNAIGMSAGVVVLVIAALVRGEEWSLPTDSRTWAALAWLVVAGSVALFILFLYVIARWTASATVYALTLMPVVAVTLGALLADEEITLDVIAGGALVIAAVYVAALSGRRKSAPGEPPHSQVADQPV
ncbi:MAG: EamA family transporter [Actinobacteria bacterium]|nr:EamA family transporter [Actinomycetota bacterium]